MDWKRIIQKNCLYPGPDYTNVLSFSIFINPYRKIPDRGFAFLINKKNKYIRKKEKVLKKKKKHEQKKKKKLILKSSTFLFDLAT